MAQISCIEDYDLSQPFHDVYPFPPLVRAHGNYRSSLEVEWLKYLSLSVISAGAALYNRHGTWGGYKMEVNKKKYSNMARFNVYFDQNGLRESYFDMFKRAGLGHLSTFCSNYRCSNFGRAIRSLHSQSKKTPPSTI